MSCATCLKQLDEFTIGCVACNWILVTNDSCKPKISTNVIQNFRIKPNDFCKNQQLANIGLNIKLKNDKHYPHG
jgi:hypothetical protein